MPDPIDVHLAQRLRTLRLQRVLSLQALAQAVGVTYQQIQKYESAADRISASRLYRLSKTLGVPIADFFEGLTEI